MSITHIFFDLHGTLIDPAGMRAAYNRELAVEMARRYGGSVVAWVEADHLIALDWDSYYADLDLGGDDSVAQMWEGLYRITRALFRLTHTPEPDRETLHRLIHEIPSVVCRRCDAFYPEAKAVIRRLHELGYVLGVTSHAIVEQAQATLIGGGVAEYFTGPLVGPETAGSFLKNSAYFRTAARLAGVEPAACLVIDDQMDNGHAAQTAGMQALVIQRKLGVPNHNLQLVLSHLQGS